MMNKLKSAKANLVRFLFVLPLIAIILVSFRKQITDTLVPPDKNLQQQEQLSMADTTPVVKNYTDKGYYIEIYNNKVKDNPLIVIKDKNRKEVQRLTMDDWNSRKDYYDNLYGELPPPPPPAPPPPPPPVKLPENVKRININNDVTTVWLKNGEKEKYDMNIPAQKNEFEKKYGPPPPPPAAPAVPEMVPSGNGNNNSALGNSYEITDKKATINLKNEATEIYDLTNQTDRKKFEDKYGKINASGVSSTAPTPVAYASGTGGNTVIAPMNPVPGERPLVVNNNGYTITGMEAILITITKNSSRKQLDEYISQMKAKGIELIFDEIEYNNGVLVKITGTMKSKDSRSNFVATDFSKLELAMIKDGDKTWFKVSTKDNKEII